MSAVDEVDRTSTREVWIAVAAAFAFALLVYLPSIANGFAYDDVVIVKGDTRVTEFQFNNIFAKPYWTAPGFALYRPLVTLSFAVDWALFNGHPGWFHLINAVWHALATAAVFWLLLAWFRPRAALLGAILFAVHPVHTEAVANVVGRAELMAGALILAACALWAHAWPQRRIVRMGLVLLLFALALLCKESAAVLPGLLILIDAARGEWRSLRALPAHLLKRAPELIACTVVLAIALVVRSRIAGGLTPTDLDPIMEVVRDPGDRILTALQVWPQFVRLMFFPVTLLADYGPRFFMPTAIWTLAGVAGLFMVVGVLVAGFWLLDRGHGLAALAVFWFPLTALPVTNLLVPIGVILAERTLYVPSVALSFGAAALVPIAGRLPASTRRGVLVAASLVFALLAVRTITRIPHWDSTDRIMMELMKDRPDSFRANWHAARMARNQKKPGEAVQRYARAIELWPYRRRLVVEAAAYAGSQARAREAARLAYHGTQLWPENLELQRLLAAHALDIGDTVTARAALARGLKLAPKDPLLNQMQTALAHPTNTND